MSELSETVINARIIKRSEHLMDKPPKPTYEQLQSKLAEAEKVIDAAIAVKDESPNVYGSGNEIGANEALLNLYELIAQYKQGEK